MAPLFKSLEDDCCFQVDIGPVAVPFAQNMGAFRAVASWVELASVVFNNRNLSYVEFLLHRTSAWKSTHHELVMKVENARNQMFALDLN